MNLRELENTLVSKYGFKNIKPSGKFKKRVGGIRIKFGVSPLASDGNPLIDYNAYYKTGYKDGIHGELDYLLTNSCFQVTWFHNNPKEFYIYPDKVELKYCRR